MIQKTKRPSRGRPLKNDNQPLDQKSIRLTSAQWGKIAANGGLDWLRALIDGAGAAGHRAPEQSVTEQGWIEWIDTGGYAPPPVGPDDVIAFRLSNGEVLSTDYPHCLNWIHEGEPGDIVAYRLLMVEEVADLAPWVEWTGGECPVDPASVVQVRLFNYGQNEAVIAGPQNWKHLPKTHHSYDINIVAYRVHK